MNDALFASQHDLEPARITRLAADLELDLTRFEVCLRADSTATSIIEDIEAAAAHEATGTPFFVVGDETYRGAMTPERIEEIISNAAGS